MAYDQGLVDRIREVLAAEPGLTERRMFGSYAFLINGHMCGGVKDDRLIIRTRPENYQATLEKPNVYRFPEEGKVLNNFATVDDVAFPEDDDLLGWLDEGIRLARSLPPK